MPGDAPPAFPLLPEEEGLEFHELSERRQVGAHAWGAWRGARGAGRGDAAVPQPARFAAPPTTSCCCCHVTSLSLSPLRVAAASPVLPLGCPHGTSVTLMTVVSAPTAVRAVRAVRRPS
jgi:hypothetical protein